MTELYHGRGVGIPLRDESRSPLPTILWYDLDGEYASAEAAEGAARRRLAELERSQPSVRSGGQGGIQDQVWIVRPSGERYRWT